MFSLTEFAAHLTASAERVPFVITGILTVVTASAAERARGYIGHYQPDIKTPLGDLPAWDKLSSATLLGFDHPLAGWIPGKVELGYAPPDNPLLRDGALRESIGWEVEGDIGTVGSDSKIGLYQEMGTPDALYPIPPRPFLARAVLEGTEQLATEAGMAAMTLLTPA